MRAILAKPARSFGILGIILIAANGMIGTGIFALPGKLDAAVGNFAPLLLIIAGLGMACIASSFGDCARHFDSSGGPLLYVATAFGPLPGFVIGWLAYVARVASIAANATILATTVAVFYPQEFDKLNNPPPNTANAALMLGRMDGNRDRQVSLAEHRAAMLANFDRLDTNRDGVVSAAEMKAGGAQPR